MSDVCFRVCNRDGWVKYDSLDDLDAYLSRQMASGFVFSPIKRIVKVTSEEVQLTDVALKYNAVANKKKEGEK